MWQLLSIFLQASGVLFILWITFGWLLLGGERGGMCVRVCAESEPDRVEAYIRSCVWLREMGLLRMRVLLVDRGMKPEERNRLEAYTAGRDDVVFCEAPALMEILEKEAKTYGGTGSVAGNCGSDRI